jgi:dephospho-CoA kinase
MTTTANSRLVGIAFTGPIGSGKTTAAKVVLDLLPASEGRMISFAAPLKELAVKLLGRPIDKKTDRKFLQALGMGMRSDVLKDMGFDVLVKYLDSHNPELDSRSRWVSPYKDATANKIHQDALCEMIDVRQKLSKAALLDFCFANPTWGNPKFWADKVREKLAALEAEGVRIVASDDMRFFNEYLAVCQGFGLKSVRLEVPEEVRRARLVERDGAFNPHMDNDVSELEHKFIPFEAKFDTSEDHALESISDYAHRLLV